MSKTKPKDWLLKNGHIKVITRGRLSREHISLIEEAVKNGAVIEGYSLTTAPSAPSADKTSESKTVKRTAVDPNVVYDVPDEIRPEEVWQARRVSDNKPVGMRTVCNVCSNSLTYCRDQFPKVWVDHITESVVTFKPRTTPLTRRKW